MSYVSSRTCRLWLDNSSQDMKSRSASFVIFCYFHKKSHKQNKTKPNQNKHQKNPRLLHNIGVIQVGNDLWRSFGPRLLRAQLYVVSENHLNKMSSTWLKKDRREFILFFLTHLSGMGLKGYRPILIEMATCRFGNWNWWCLSEPVFMQANKILISCLLSLQNSSVSSSLYVSKSAPQCEFMKVSGK